MVMGVVIVLEVVEVIACWQDGVKSGLEWSWGSNYQVVITLMAVTLVPASTEDGEGSLVVLKEMIFMVVYLLAVVSNDGIGRIVPGDNGGDGSLCMLLVVVLIVCRKKVVLQNQYGTMGTLFGAQVRFAMCDKKLPLIPF